jgi:hypothetical protein
MQRKAERTSVLSRTAATMDSFLRGAQLSWEQVHAIAALERFHPPASLFFFGFLYSGVEASCCSSDQSLGLALLADEELQFTTALQAAVHDAGAATLHRPSRTGGAREVTSVHRLCRDAGRSRYILHSRTRSDGRHEGAVRRGSTHRGPLAARRSRAVRLFAPSCLRSCASVCTRSATLLARCGCACAAGVRRGCLVRRHPDGRGPKWPSGPCMRSFG